MNRPNFEPIFSEKREFCEKCSDVPVKTFIPHQAMDLKELVSRFEHGQRLNVHENFRPMSNFTQDSIYEESFDDAPPSDVHDIVDVERYYQAHQVHKSEYKAKKAKSKQAPPKEEAPQDKPDPAESNPSE